MSALLERRLNPNGNFRLSAKREDKYRRILHDLKQTDFSTEESRTILLLRIICTDLLMEIEALQAMRVASKDRIRELEPPVKPEPDA